MGCPLPHTQETISGFLPVEAWEPYLSMHPDGKFASFLRRDFKHGFRVGFDPAHRLYHAGRNHQSVSANEQTGVEYLRLEVATGKLAIARDASCVHSNPIGMIPKLHQPGKFRLIVDLSAPSGHSVNHGIPSDLCSISYASLDLAAQLVKQYGKGH